MKTQFSTSQTALFFLSVILGTFLSGCSTADIKQHHPSGSNIQNATSNISEPVTKLRSQEVYQQQLLEKVSLVEWLSESIVCWTTENSSADGIRYRIYVLDINKETEHLVFETKVEDAHSFDMAVELADEQLQLYLRDTSDTSIYRKVVISTSDWSITNEETLKLAQNILWAQKSKQDILISQDIITDKKWNIILYPLDAPEQFDPLQQFSDTRYDFAETIWSPSGEYFMLANRDALGMERFESMADLFAYSKNEWPKALQYDVFEKDGSFAFSFAVDFIYKEDGSNTDTRAVHWIPGDQIYISTTFFNAATERMRSTDRILNNLGEVVYEETYEGDNHYYSRANFANDSIYTLEKNETEIHLLQLSFPTGNIVDLGPIAESNDWDKISMDISPNGSFALIRDISDNTIRVLKFKQ